jgi:RNAse (barnase) inhibitor barstar
MAVGMDYDKLVKPGPPEFYVTSRGESDFANLYNRLTATYKKAVVRMIRGKKSQTIDELFNEVSAALQFPYYFGENWAAFSECISDLDWVPGEAYILLFSDANLLLQQESPADFRVLTTILTNANEEWTEPNKYIPRNRPVTAFHVVFQVASEDLASFSERVKEAGVTLQPL